MRLLFEIRRKYIQCLKGGGKHESRHETNNGNNFYKTPALLFRAGLRLHISLPLGLLW